MKITIDLDDGKKQVFQNVTDAYLAVRQLEPMQNKKGKSALLPETRSFSWGANLRELVKEIRQSIVELDDVLKGIQNADRRG